MGGIMSFFAFMYRPDVFSFALSFSPAFFNYRKREWRRYLDLMELSPEKNGRVYFYVGGRDFEEVFYPSTVLTYDYLRRHGFSHDRVRLMLDSYEIHHEKAWAKYLEGALKFFLLGE